MKTKANEKIPREVTDPHLDCAEYYNVTEEFDLNKQNLVGSKVTLIRGTHPFLLSQK